MEYWAKTDYSFRSMKIALFQHEKGVLISTLSNFYDEVFFAKIICGF